MIKYILIIAALLLACTPLKIETIDDIISPPEVISTIPREETKEEVETEVEEDPDDSVWILKGPVTTPRGCKEWRKRNAEADC